MIANNKTGLWSHQVPNQSPALIIISVLFLLVTTIFFCLRLRARWRLRRRGEQRNAIRHWFEHLQARRFGRAFSGQTDDRILHLGYTYELSSDTMVAAAYLTLVVQTIFGGLAAHYGFGKHRVDILTTFPKAMYWFYLYQICYKLLGGFTKLSFCFLYLRIFPLQDPHAWYQKHFKKMVTATALVTGAGTFAFTMATIFQCTPIDRAWDRTVPGHCTDNLSFWFSHAAFNSFMDIIVFILPLPVIRKLKVIRSDRIGLISTFALGAFVIAASIARMGNLVHSAASTSDPTWGSMPALIWTEVEANTAVIVCCCPALAAVFKRFWHKICDIIGRSVSSTNDPNSLPTDQRPEQQQKSVPGGDQPSRTSQIRSIWSKLTRQQPKPPQSSIELRPYTSGNLAFVSSAGSKKTRRNWYGGRSQHDSWNTGDEESGEPVSYLAPKLKSGGLYKKRKDPEGAIMRQQDVMVSTRRRSEEEDPESAEFRDMMKGRLNG